MARVAAMSIAEVLSGRRRWHIETCRAEELEPQLPDGCVDLILTDPPFHRVKDLAWDREHKTAGGFLDWIGERFSAWRRIMAPNGSLYVFASPTMTGRLECKVRENFNVIGAITWAKPTDYDPGDARATAVRARDAAALRTYFHYSERVIFAEHIRGVGAVLRGMREQAGMSTDQVERALGFVDKQGRGSRLCYRWECGDCLPTEEQWLRVLCVLGASGPSYAEVARPFTVSAEVPYTDVWTYPTVQSYPGKHPCEKPAQMALDVVRASSRPGGLVLDLFTGSGKFPAAAVALGRRAIACDMDPAWCDVARERCRVAEETGMVPERSRKKAPPPKPGQVMIPGFE